MSAFASNLVVPATGCSVSGGPFFKAAEYYGCFYLNTATSLPNGAPTAVTSSSNQWTVVPALNNQNATSLLNSSGAVVAPVKGLYSLSLSAFMSTNVTINEFQIWFVVTSASGQFSPRLGLTRQNSSSFNIGMATCSADVNLYKGDVVTGYVNQITGATQTLAVTTNGQTGASGAASTAGTLLTVYLVQPQA